VGGGGAGCRLSEPSQDIDITAEGFREGRIPDLRKWGGTHGSWSVHGVHAGVVPGLRDELDNETWRGLLHVETGCVARACQRAIDGGDVATVRRHFAFMREAWINGDDDVRNAIG
jgi:hypothetical protein